MGFASLSSIKMFCPNCGIKLSAFKGDDNAIRIDCPRCKIKIFSKQRNCREICIKTKKQI